jgi:hypothetical protein
MDNTNQKPLYIYNELGSIWPLSYSILPLVFIGLFAVGLFSNLSPNGTHSNSATWNYSIAIILLIITLWQIFVRPSLTIVFNNDKIDVLNKHGAIVTQRWVINKLEIKNFKYHSVSPYREIDFNTGSFFPAFWVYRKYFNIPTNVIVLNNHKSAVEIVSATQSWMFGLLDSELVFNKIKEFYKCEIYFNISIPFNNLAVISLKKPRLIHFNPVRKQLILIPPLIFAILIFYDIYDLNGSLPIQFYLVLIICAVTIFNIWSSVIEHKYSSGHMVLEAFSDKIIIHRGFPKKSNVIIKRDEMQRITIINVENGKYPGLSKYFEGARFSPWLRSFKAVVIETIKGNWVFDIPHPDEAEEAFKKMYELD